jgi:heme-degrading monooxygenase HmoA
MWRAQSSLENSDKYVEFVTQKIFPKLAEIEGHRGAYLLRRIVDGSVECVVLTLWESMDAVRRFAGATPDNAVVEAEAQAVLSSFDDFVTHYDVVYTNVKETD